MAEGLMKAIVVIPTYNERESLRELVDEIRRYTPAMHVLVVDDSSPDGTGAVAEELSRQHPGTIFVLHRQRKEGLGRAYVAGLRYALAQDYDVIVQMDADLSHDPKYLPLFLDRIRRSDFVLGSRYVHGISVVNWDFSRLLLSKLATSYARWVTGLRYTDLTSGFKCWRRSVLQAIAIEATFSNGYLFQIETTFRAHRMGFRAEEIAIIFVDRNRGRSKMNWRIIGEAIVGVLRLRLSGRVAAHTEASIANAVPRTNDRGTRG